MTIRVNGIKSNGQAQYSASRICKTSSEVQAAVIELAQMGYTRITTSGEED